MKRLVLSIGIALSFTVACGGSEETPDVTPAPEAAAPAEEPASEGDPDPAEEPASEGDPADDEAADGEAADGEEAAPEGDEAPAAEAAEETAKKPMAGPPKRSRPGAGNAGGAGSAPPK